MRRYSLDVKITLFLFAVTALNLAACARENRSATHSSPANTPNAPAFTEEAAQTLLPAQPAATPPAPPAEVIARIPAQPDTPPAEPTSSASASRPAPPAPPISKPGAVVPEVDPAESPEPATFEEELLALINASRAQKNRPALRLSIDESKGVGHCSGSYGHSVQMQRAGKLSHDEADFCLSSQIEGENVGMSTGGKDYALRTIHQNMMNEGAKGGHYKNIMNAKFDSVGIGLYYRGGTLWLTEDFMYLGHSNKDNR